MPGSVSDAYDPEWGTAANGDKIRESLKEMYDVISKILTYKKPMYILDLVRADYEGPDITAGLTEKQWRLLRFACERAGESI